MKLPAELRKRSTILLALLGLSQVGLWGCGGDEGPPISQEETDRIVQVGEAATGELLRTLVGRLTAAMEEGGPVGAVEFCSEEAIPLTGAVEVGQEGVMAIKRTSFRYRNPANAPDEADEQALRYFEEHMMAGGEVPSRYVQKVSEEEYRYYQPLFLGEVCLRCHGQPDAMDPALVELLGSKYPGDLATGYEAGDFRGVVRVSVPASPSGSAG